MSSYRRRGTETKPAACRTGGHAPRRRYGPAAWLLFALLDVLYGRPRTLSKFKVLEVVARVPYQAWESVAYVAVTHRYSRPAFARRIFESVNESREQHPAFEDRPYEGLFVEEYGRFDSIGDLFRQIGHHERVHKKESLARMDEPRFR